MIRLEAAILIRDHWLEGEGVHLLPTDPSWYSAHSRFRTISQNPAGPCWHWSATGPGTAENMARNRMRVRGPYDPENPKLERNRPSSWHLTIARDGQLWQMVSFQRPAWHAGGGKDQKLYKSDLVRNACGVNAALVGIELEGFGKDYPEAQIIAAARFLRAGNRAYGWRLDRDCSWEHRTFAAPRKSDCGPPWTDEILPRVLKLAAL